jgi:hypothetical protein
MTTKLNVWYTPKQGTLAIPVIVTTGNGESYNTILNYRYTVDWNESRIVKLGTDPKYKELCPRADLIPSFLVVHNIRKL